MNTIFQTEDEVDRIKSKISFWTFLEMNISCHGDSCSNHLAIFDFIFLKIQSWWPAFLTVQNILQ